MERLRFSLALLVLYGQIEAVAFCPWSIVIRILVPLTMVLVPFVFWSNHKYLGFWVGLVGVTANLVVMISNGGLMPIERSVFIENGNPSLGAKLDSGSWIQYSKSVLVDDGDGRLLFLDDNIPLKISFFGVVASPGDFVITAGLFTFLTEFFWLKRKEKRTIQLLSP